jgi:hypothetical protein
VIWEDSDGNAWFTADQPSTQFSSFGIPAVSDVGVELDRKLATLLEVLGVEVPRPAPHELSARSPFTSLRNGLTRSCES